MKGYRLKNIDKVLLLDFVKYTNSTLYQNTVKDITSYRLRFKGKSFDFYLKFYGEFIDLSKLTMSDCFNFVTGLLPEDYNRETLTNIINLYNKNER